MNEDFKEIVQRLDSMEKEVMDWEADFLESIMVALKKGWSLSPKQAKVLRGMRDRYLEG